MGGFFLGLAIWMIGGWLGAQIAAFFNQGSKLGFWNRLWAGVIGGMLLGLFLDWVPALKNVTRLLHSGHVEDALAGVLGGLAVALAGSLVAGQKETAPKA